MRIEVTGADELIADLAREVATIERAEGRAVAGEARRTVDRMRARAPRDTGQLAASIGADVDGLAADVGPTVPYAPFVEYGTSRQAPQPFAGQSLDEGGFEKAVGDAVGL